MSIFEWRDEYSVDNGMIDIQHKKLLRIAESLFTAVLAQKDDEYLQKCYNELYVYTSKHFSDEMAYFRNIKAQNLNDHDTDHLALANELEETWQKERFGFQSEQGRLLLNWVEERLLPHMMIEDQKTFQSRQS